MKGYWPRERETACGAGRAGMELLPKTLVLVGDAPSRAAVPHPGVGLLCAPASPPLTLLLDLGGEGL